MKALTHLHITLEVTSCVTRIKRSHGEPGTTSYDEKTLKNYELMFDEKPKEASSPMVSNHPKLDLTEEIDPNGIKQYQSLFGALQCLVTLGRFDIRLGVATM